MADRAIVQSPNDPDGFPGADDIFRFAGVGPARQSFAIGTN